MTDTLHNPAPLASESAAEHIKNAQQLALATEDTLAPNDYEARALVAALKRRLGWALVKVEQQELSLARLHRR